METQAIQNPGIQEGNLVGKDTRSDGEKLRDLYLENQDQEKVQDYTKKAQDFLDVAVEDIEKSIKKGNPPITVISSLESKAGIIAPNKQLEELFASFLFNLVAKREAKKRGMEINFQPSMKQVAPDQQPILELIMTCTFSIN